ncbi:hypothetical protein E3N88_06243 [Mikania micrantha]|uniref:Uncharacterized protein n=1 Tax=Mikania micrantha TaxID=192012 RepID=A0A5N6PQA8_9ASTR|nr:hypothetical protein E3N88_06243 [Mikania micrantha]
MVWDPQPIETEVAASVECHVNQPLDVTLTFVQEMVKACEVVELQISSSKGNEKQNIDEDEHPVDHDDAVVDLDNVITTIPFLQTQPEPTEPVLRTPDVVNTPPREIKIKYERKCRSKIIGEQLRSPYVERSVVLGTKLSKEERMICQYVFHPKNDPHTILFITNNDTEFYKVIMESLFPEVYIHTGVLEAFVHVLNADEKQRGPDSPFRLFLPPNILTTWQLV